VQGIKAQLQPVRRRGRHRQGRQQVIRG
jgi:hypothetical protein